MSAAHDRFASFLATLGRGPGRSRALTREEAREAFGMVLRDEPDPRQIGAFLMLLRYRGEDAAEITGIVEAARAQTGLPAGSAELDWPSYGAGRTRGAPWYLLAALALARAGVAVWDLAEGCTELTLPAMEGLRPHPPAGDTPALLAAVWTGEAVPETPLATIRATIALALLALARAAEPSRAMRDAADIWRQRR